MCTSIDFLGEKKHWERPELPAKADDPRRELRSCDENVFVYDGGFRLLRHFYFILAVICL